VIHIIQQFTNAFGGTEMHAYTLYKLLERKTAVRLWSEFDPDPRLSDWPIDLIRPKRLAFPKTGTFIFVGACWYVGPWLDYAFPRRIIVLHNYSHDSYKSWFKRASRPWHPKIEWGFVSDLIRLETALKGIVVTSPIDLNRFKPVEHCDRAGSFTVGRLSRDVPEKFHEDDCALFVSLASAGVRIRIMGGTVLRDRLPAHPLIELLPEGAEQPEKFLNSLDCFLFRTRSDLFEASGRVVHEAMACGLPVVCGSRGGYTEQIRQGKNGFVFDSNQQAVDSIERLRQDALLRQSISREARQTAIKLYGDGLPPEVIKFYLR